jgi:hypothetical protein
LNPNTRSTYTNLDTSENHSRCRSKHAADSGMEGSSSLRLHLAKELDVPSSVSTKL